MNNIRPQLVYILAASHSGSTLLAMLLGAHEDTVTVGELKATSLGDTDRYLCSCGARIRECSFWQEISKEMARRGLDFDVTEAATDIRSGATPYQMRLLRPLHRGPFMELVRDTSLGLSPSWSKHMAENRLRNRMLIESVCQVARVNTIIDSSKIGIRLKYLLKDPELNVKIVRLIRDGRAVALTYAQPSEYADAQDPRLRCGGTGEEQNRKALSFREGAAEWKRSNEEAECILGNLEKSRFLEVRYEDLCENTEDVLNRIFLFLGLDPEKRLQDFRSRISHVVGNGMRLDTSSEIRLDDRWRTVLTTEDLDVFEAVAGTLRKKYGYK